MTALGPEALRQLALKVLALNSGSAGGAADVAAGARRASDALVQVTTPLIGQVGVDALTGRAVHLAHQQYPWLVDAETGQASEPFAQVMVRLEQQDPAVATEGAAMVFATFAGLLVTFIGEPVTTRLLRQAWPEAFSDASAEER
jgi:hypothetical protein